jgi:hypothetical protein
MIQLISSYFFDEPVHLNSFYIRKGNRKQEFWTHKEVQGPRMTDKVIYILTSGYTFSGAEEFTYNMKNLKRATIIGETTGGGAHPVNLRVFAELQLQVSIPFGRAINPVSGTNWEGTGVSPHIQVPADKALSRARQEALKLLIDKNDDPIAKNRLHWLLERLELKEKPIIMDSRVLDDYVGHYGARTVKMKDGNLHLQWEERVGFRLIPTGNDIFMVDKVEYLRIRFDRDRNSKVTTMVLLNDDGTSEIYSRSDL